MKRYIRSNVTTNKFYIIAHNTKNHIKSNTEDKESSEYTFARRFCNEHRKLIDMLRDN